MINKFYTVSYFTDFGLRMYLSNVGFNVAIGHGLIFEPEFRNAQKFNEAREAKANANAAKPLYGNKVIVQRHVIKDDGSVEVTIVK